MSSLTYVGLQSGFNWVFKNAWAASLEGAAAEGALAPYNCLTYWQKL